METSPVVCRMCQVRPALEGESVCAVCLRSWLTWKREKQAMRAAKARRRSALLWLRYGPCWPDVRSTEEKPR